MPVDTRLIALSLCHLRFAEDSCQPPRKIYRCSRCLHRQASGPNQGSREKRETPTFCCPRLRPLKMVFFNGLSSHTFRSPRPHLPPMAAIRGKNIAPRLRLMERLCMSADFIRSWFGPFGAASTNRCRAHLSRSATLPVVPICRTCLALRRRANHNDAFARLAPIKRGGSRSSRTLGAGCDGRCSVRRNHCADE
jgi:hypothetical protein